MKDIKTENTWLMQGDGLSCNKMKTYTVYFSEPVTMKYKGDKFNKELKRWEHDVDCEKTSVMFTFYSLAPAKKLIKENMDKYVDSSITKIGQTVTGKTSAR